MNTFARRLAFAFASTLMLSTAVGCNQTGLSGVDYDHYYGETGGAEDGEDAGNEGGDAGFDDGAADDGADSGSDGGADDGGDEGGADDGGRPGTFDEPVCGNGELELGEECDDGADNADDAACTSSCTINVCGDGHVYAGVEACDNGDANGPDESCTDTCEAQGPA